MNTIAPNFRIGKKLDIYCLYGKTDATAMVMYGRILKQLRESRARTQAEVARSVGISPAQLARLESNQRGLYVEDFVKIAEALGEKPGNLLPNDLGAIGHLKPLIDRLSAVRPELLARLTAIVDKIVQLTDHALAFAPREDGRSHAPSLAPRRKKRP